MKSKILAALSALLLTASAASVQAATGVEKTAFQVKGMTCGSCEKQISHSLKKIEGVQSITFKPKKGEKGVRVAEVTYAAGSKVTPAELVKAVDAAGYQASALK